MSVNSYFNHLNNFSEQKLRRDCVIEVIQMFGMLVYYLPKTKLTQDYLFGDANLAFKNAVSIEMMLGDVKQFGGQREMIAKFGFEVNDEISLLVSKQRFKDVITDHYSDITKPHEGDLIAGVFDPRKLFEITFVDDEIADDFYQFGKSEVWEVKAQRFTYSQEHLETGIPEIDKLETELKQDETTGVTKLNGQEDNTNIQIEADSGVMDQTSTNPFGRF